MILKTIDLSKNYSQASTDIHALSNVNIEINKGDTIAIVGPSGSGKTTLLSLLSGLERPSTGQIIINDTDITKLSEKQLSQFRAENIGIVFQQYHLMPHLTALENVSLPLEILRTKEPRKRALAALEKMGLANRLNHTPSQLSGGECQRVAIARALVVNPNILMADEPSGNLDTETGKVILDQLFNLIKSQSLTLILVTHDLELAKRCNKVIKLKSGLIE